MPEIPHTINIVHGDQGSAKSTFCEMVKNLVDPDKLSMLTIPKDKNEFVQQLYHNYVAVYDNVKVSPGWLSDEVCKAITGIGNSKRKLYSNDDDVIYKYMRCIILNGINISLSEPDALDRSILIKLSRIPREQRVEASEVKGKFEELRPKVFGYILDILVKALQIKPTLKLKDLPRMADFTVWGEAISQAMGYEPYKFINVYFANIDRQNVEAIEANPLGLTISKFVETLPKNETMDGKVRSLWQGSLGELLKELQPIASELGINTDQKLWPKAPNALVRRLRQISSNLLEGLGISIVIGRRTANDGKANTSTITVEKISPVPPVSPVQQNQARILPESTGDIDRTGDIIPPAEQIPPVQNPENHVQNSSTGDTGGTGDICGSKGDEGCAVYKGVKITQKGQFWRCRCGFENIYLETIRHHIDNSRDARHAELTDKGDV